MATRWVAGCLGRGQKLWGTRAGFSGFFLVPKTHCPPFYRPTLKALAPFQIQKKVLAHFSEIENSICPPGAPKIWPRPLKKKS